MLVKALPHLGYAPLVGKHASGPSPDPNDEIREMFRVDIDDRAKRTGWQVCAVTVAGGLSAWAISAFTGGLLGPWRFALVVPIALYTAYTGIFAVVFLAFALAAKTTAKQATTDQVEECTGTGEPDVVN